MTEAEKYLLCDLCAKAPAVRNETLMGFSTNECQYCARILDERRADV